MLPNPLRYDFEIRAYHGVLVSGSSPKVLMWTRSGDTQKLFRILMRHAAGQVKKRGQTVTRTALVVEGQSLRCFVFTA